MENTEIMDKIVSIEWDMFTSVNDGEERASCQEDRATFEGMRKAQFSAWPPDATASYLDDLEKARLGGRNLIEEKYIHMMKTTEPTQYDALLHRIVSPPDDTALALAREISDKLLEQTRILFEEYPYVSGRGRPLYSALDYAAVSVETYQYSELLTYSAKTLAALKAHVDSLEKDGVSLARVILENTVFFYGYKSLEAAEKTAKERADEADEFYFEPSFGCSCGDCEI